MKTIKGDIFNGEWDGLCHCCNLHKTWGAGIVVPLKKKYPSAYKADLDSPDGDDKLGHFSYAAQLDGRVIFNLYGQVGIGNNGDPLNRNCQYDFIFNSLLRVCQMITRVKKDRDKEYPFILALPKIGCGLAGGEWIIVEAIIKSIEQKFPNIQFDIYEL